MTGSNSSRKVPIHRGACPRKSCKRLEQAHYILCSCLFLTAGHDNLLASLPDPLGYLPSEDGESIQQELTLNEAQKTRRSVRSFGRRKIRNAVHTSISNMNRYNASWSWSKCRRQATELMSNNQLWRPYATSTCLNSINSFMVLSFRLGFLIIGIFIHIITPWNPIICI